MKKYFIVLIAVVFSVTSAFTFKPTFSTFRFDGSTSAPADRVNPSQYTLISPSCGETESILCAIEAANGINNKPVIEEDTPLYTALWNGGSTSGPNFSPAYVIGKTP